MSKDGPFEAFLYLSQEMPQSRLHGIAGGTAAVYSNRCPGKETPNEDGAALITWNSHSGVLVVADGLGGIKGGKEASGLAIRTIRSTLKAASPNGTPMRTAILNGIESANQAILEQGLGSATTLAIAEIQENTIRPYHVGDSAILVLGQRGKVKLQTISHSPVGFAQEAGLLDEKSAMHHEDRHMVSNVIGMPGMRIEVGPPLKLAPRDTLLLASDGLFDNLLLEEIASRMCIGPINEAADRLAIDSHLRMIKPKEGEPSKPDDLTLVIFRPDTNLGSHAKLRSDPH